MKIVAFGEIMLRLSAGEEGIRHSTAFLAHYGGTEANVLACLAALGHETKYLTALPVGPLGEAVLDHLNGHRVDTSSVLVRGNKLGTYFSETGNASRGARVVYDRRHSAFTHLAEGDFCYDEVFRDADLFHISGISFALSPSSRELAFRLMEEARARGIAVSFDFNYRPALWTVEEAREVFVRAANEADVLLASTRDLETFLQQTPEEVLKKGVCRCLIVRDRRILTADRHSVRVAVTTKKAHFCSPELAFPVTERIGGGDAFNGAMLHALLTGKTIEEATMSAITAFAYKHTIPGDTLARSEGEIAGYRDRLEELA